MSGSSEKIAGRTPDPYVRDYLVNLNGAFPVNIKVQRIMQIAHHQNYKMKFNLIHMLKLNMTKEVIQIVHFGLKVDAEQFSSIPSRKYLVKGIKVKIPHNATVNADGSLSYTETFNGTLGAAQYTNDPAWCLYD